MSIVRLASVLEPRSRLIPRALKLAAESYTGIFTAARLASDKSFSLTVDGKTLTIPTFVDSSIVEPASWITAFWLSLLCGDSTLTDSLCELPTSILRRSSTISPEYFYRFVDALQGCYRRAPDAGELIVAALEATDPNRSDIHAPDWVLLLDVPALQILFYIVDRDPRLPEAFENALKSHQQFWTQTPERARKSEGFVSIPLSGLAAMASYAGIVLNVDSEYLIRPEA